MNWDHFVQAATLVIATGFLGFIWRLGNRVTGLEKAVEYLMQNGILAQQRDMDERLSRIEGHCEAVQARKAH